MQHEEATGVMICRHCGEDIYPDDIIYNLEDIYNEGAHIVHENCLGNSLKKNPEATVEYITSDLCLLQDLSDIMLRREAAIEYIDRLGECNDWN